MTSGGALALAVVLAGAGVPKLWRPDHVAGALRRVFAPGRAPRTVVLARYGRLLGAWELLLAAALVTVGGVFVGVAVAGTFAGFLGFVLLAVRRGASCGCWASLTEGPAGGAEVGRTLVLAVAAGWVAAAGAPVSMTFATVAWATVVLVAMCLGAVVGGLVAPVRLAKVARRLTLRAAPTWRGRVLARLAFLAGFVHAGTQSEQERLVSALLAQQSATAVPSGAPPSPTGPVGPVAQNASA